MNAPHVDMLASPLLTGSRAAPVTSPAMSKLPGLHAAIAQRRAQDLRLPAFALPFESAAAQLDQPRDDDDDAKRRKKGTRRGTLNPEAKSVLKAWMFSPEHFAHPYPSEEEKEELASEAGIEVKQLSNWFTNARKRLWQPVLRQSGVEVKNFLSTGRGGPRGNKLDVPANLQHLVSPPSSPERRAASPLKRAWSDVEASLPATDEPRSSSHDAAPPKRKKLSTRKKALKDDDAARATIAHQLSHELRLALAAPPKAAASPTTVARFQESELLAATSLLGLYQQCASVH